MFSCFPSGGHLLVISSLPLRYTLCCQHHLGDQFFCCHHHHHLVYCYLFVFSFFPHCAAMMLFLSNNLAAVAVINCCHFWPCQVAFPPERTVLQHSHFATTQSKTHCIAGINSICTAVCNDATCVAIFYVQNTPPPTNKCLIVMAEKCCCHPFPLFFPDNLTVIAAALPIDCCFLLFLHQGTVRGAWHFCHLVAWCCCFLVMLLPGVGVVWCCCKYGVACCCCCLHQCHLIVVFSVFKL